MPDLLQDRVTAAVGDLYEIEGELGRGGMSVVYRARDVRLRRLLALKVLPPELAFRGDIRTRFLREAETAAQLSHPNIVPIYAVDERDGLVYFAMQLVDGESLAARLRREPRPPIEVVRRVLREVADGLAYAHGKGVVHRDVKPDNVLLDRESGRAIVTDFGIARAAEGDGRLTVTGVAVGTPAYMSPEQALGERDVDGRSDIYSLGVVGYEMLAGAPPFSADNTPAMLMKQLSEHPRPLGELRADAPPSLIAAIERAMVKDRRGRWPDAGAFRDALAAADNGRAAAGLPVPAGDPRSTPTDFGWHAVDRQLRDRVRQHLSGERPIPEAYRDYRPAARLDPRRDRWRDGRDAHDGARRDRPSRETRRRSEGRSRRDERPIEVRVEAFRRKVLWSAGTISFLGVVNLATSPHFPWVVFPAAGMASDLLARWSSIQAEGVGFWEAMLGDGGAARRRATMDHPTSAVVPSGPPIVGRVRRFRRTAGVAAGLGAVAVSATAVGAAAHGPEPIIVLAAFSSLGTAIAGALAAVQGWRLHTLGVRVREALGGRWRQAAVLADPRPREAKLAEALATLAPAEVVNGPHGAAVRRAADDQAAVREMVHLLPAADRALLPDIQPTVDALVKRVAGLAASLHRLDADLPPGALADLDARLGAAEHTGATTPDRERHIALLHRQRSSLADLAERRAMLAAQLESASLVLQNIRLDLVKLGSSGVGAMSELTTATQEARALSRDIGHVLDAAREVRRI